MVLRTFLGIFESAISPGFSLITGMWYTPPEHISRHAVWFAGNAIAGIVGSMISYGVLHYKGSLAQWKVGNIHEADTPRLLMGLSKVAIPCLWSSNCSMGRCTVVLLAGFTCQRQIPYTSREGICFLTAKEVPANDTDQKMGKEPVYRNSQRYQNLVVPRLLLHYLCTQWRNNKRMGLNLKMAITMMLT